MEQGGRPIKSLFQMNLFTFLISDLAHLSDNYLLSAWLVQETRGKGKHNLRKGLLSYAQSLERKSFIGGEAGVCWEMEGDTVLICPVGGQHQGRDLTHVHEMCLFFIIF